MRRLRHRIGRWLLRDAVDCLDCPDFTGSYIVSAIPDASEFVAKLRAHLREG